MLPLLIISFFVMLFLGVPIAFSMAISASMVIFFSPDLPGLVMAQKMFTAMDSFSLMAIPFFMLAGNIMNETGITTKLVRFAGSVVGHITGGLAHTTCLAGMLMAGISGSANADASALGSLMVPPLKQAGYDEGFSVSLVAACGALGPVIPPSIMMIIYSGVTSISIAKLFMAGIVPGVLAGVSYMILSYIYAKRHNIRSSEHFAGCKAILVALREAVWALIMPLLILGGILSGVVTATEAGVVAVLYGLAYGFFSKALTMKKFKECLLAAAHATAVSMLIISFASLFGYMLARGNFPTVVVGALQALTSNQYIVLIFIVVVLFIMGMFVDSNAALLMLVPVFTPLIAQFGFDPLHFAMIIILTLVIGGLSPPVGLVLYIVASVDNTPLEKAVKGVWPFIGINVCIILLVMFVPQVVTTIPGLLG